MVISRRVLILIASFVVGSCAASREIIIFDWKAVPSKINSKVVINPVRGFGNTVVERRRHKADGITVDCYARFFSGGNALYIEVYYDSAVVMVPELVAMYFNGAEVPLEKKSWGYMSLCAIAPEISGGIKPLHVKYRIGREERLFGIKLYVGKSNFPFYSRALDLGRFSDVDYRPTPEEEAFIERGAKLKKKVFSSYSKAIYSGLFSHPRDHHFVTSPFWSKRMIMRYRKKNGIVKRFPDKINIHSGIDLRGAAKDPVYAMAKGRVALSEKLYYEGNFVIIDHGLGIFSYYMHLNSLKVKDGDIVDAGSLIGEVGSTGMSTAPHLHVSFIIRGVHVDPMSLVALPVRE
jgi:murein DD-endopeptidase MepM/ murein hydrolase activator NlpD